MPRSRYTLLGRCRSIRLRQNRVRLSLGGYSPQLARLGHITPARLTQIMVLLHLAPSIQEYLLFLSAGDARFVTELGLRKIAREPRWDRQRKLFDQRLEK